MYKTAIGFFAHPDDAELMCAGTLALLKEAGWSIHIVTMTPGDKGTAELSKKEISSIRKKEAGDSCKIIDATYHCLEFEDLYIVYDRDSVNRTTEMLRRIKPSVVFTASPDDYMQDHEITASIVQAACFAAGVKNMDVETPHFEPIPYLFYCDPMEGTDKMGSPIVPSFLVDITSVIDTKEKMLVCHASQRNWLLQHHKMDEYILSMKRFAQERGMIAGTKYAEGFRQHLGHGFPHDNILIKVIGDKIVFRKN
jgi:LmbE family N-acetylglucosaminyl deacetylase